ncbi:hypothetical protein [Rubritalea sp.]|uniref:hypothetical protein n=1 Tax=Rubritalea sp. TaxID=2109375 RepID=UPI003F4A9A73
MDSVESADLVVKKIESLADAVTSIAQRVDAESYLGYEQGLEFESSLRDVQDETEYLLTLLSAQPELVIKLTEPIAKLGDSLEFAASVMKQPKSL